MKKIILFCMILLGTPMSVWAGNITFVFDHVKYDRGAIRVAIYDSAESYDSGNPKVATAFMEVKEQQRRVKISCELEPGKYAAKIYHDANGNNKMDTNFIGIPKEGYGFSNNAQGNIGAPKFDAAVFTMGPEDLEMKIVLKY